ncbi:beta-ketoacyl reductase, partial [Streptomyces xinghaiensis]
WLDTTPTTPATTTQSPTDAWRYRVTWKALTEESTPASSPSGHWLLVTPPTPEGRTLGDRAAGALARQGATVERLVVDPVAVGRDGLAARLGERWDGVLSLLGADERPLPRHPALNRAVMGTTLLAQAALDAGCEARIWAVTREAVAVSPSEVPRDAGAQLWGLGRGIALEHPSLWGGLIDLPAVPDERAWARAVRRLVPHGEDQIAVRASGAYGRRLLPAPPAASRRTCTPSGTVLVTGGTGALGGHLARRLARGGTGHLVLTSRRGPDAPGAGELAGELASLGAKVTVAACDMADREAVRALLDEHRPTAVFHTAGTPHSAEFTALDETTTAGVYGGKVLGARHLDELTRELGIGLDAFVLFSSGAAVWGSGGQTAYGAANAALDALAERRRAAGLPATSVAWGLWGGGGMGEGDGEEFLSRRGLGVMPPEDALEALDRALDREDTTVVVADVDWERFAPAFTAFRPSALISRLVSDGGEAGGQDAPDGTLFAAGFAAAGPLERQEMLLGLVRRHVAAVLGHPGTADIGPDRAFKELGFSSVTAVELAGRLGRECGRKLPPTLVFDHPTAAAVAEHLAELLTPPAGPAAGPREEEARAALARVPLERLREAGLLDALLRLAADESGATTPRTSAASGAPRGREEPDGRGEPDGSGHRESPDAAGGSDALDDLDGDALVRLALGEPGE